MENKKSAVALSSVFASAGMTIMKFVVGVMTGSMGIISEAAHSALDLGAALLTFFAVKVPGLFMRLFVEWYLKISKSKSLGMPL